MSVEEFQDIIDDILIRYPQVEHHLRDRHLSSVTDLLKDPEGNARKEVDIEGFKLALSQVDLQMKSLPATAQVFTSIYHFPFPKIYFMQNNHSSLVYVKGCCATRDISVKLL